MITLSEVKSDVSRGFNSSEDSWYQLPVGVIVEVQEDDNHRGLDLYRVEFARKLTFFWAYELTDVTKDGVADETVTVT